MSKNPDDIGLETAQRIIEAWHENKYSGVFLQHIKPEVAKAIRARDAEWMDKFRAHLPPSIPTPSSPDEVHEVMASLRRGGKNNV